MSRVGLLPNGWTIGSCKGGYMSRATAILVDDEEDVLPEYQELLELEGFETLVSSDPEEAFTTVCARSDIELVITDLQMVRLDGASLIRRLREALPERRLRFIVITGDATTQHDPDVVGGPVLLKPVDCGALVAAVEAALAPA